MLPPSTARTPIPTDLPKAAPVRLPERRGVQGSNQYRRVSLEAFLAAQRLRVAQMLDAHVARVRARLREHTDDLLFEP